MSESKNWFHLSSSWTEFERLVYPLQGRIDDPKNPHPLELRPYIAVCPTIAQCIIAIGDWYLFDQVNVYSTTKPQPTPCDFVFDYSITNEHRYFEPAHFRKLGIINLEALANSIPKKLRDYSKLDNLSKVLIKIQSLIKKSNIESHNK
jgi:hypothetical protein